MLQVARLAPNLLLEAGDRVVDFLRGQLNPDGGGRDRAGESDLYYTIFVVEGLIAMRADPPIDVVRGYLLAFGDGCELDFVHICCLARAWAAIGGEGLSDTSAARMIERIESFRSTDGGYDPGDDSDEGTVYHSFLAFGAYQDLKATLPDQDRLIGCLDALRTKDGAYANQQSMMIGTTPTTAAAATLLRQLGHPVPREVGDWLLKQCHDAGGFLAIPGAPMPDLLSTATALHALAGMHVSFESAKEKCLDFVDSLWTGKAFCGSWEDDTPDSEYAYYALLALGHLSL